MKRLWWLPTLAIAASVWFWTWRPPQSAPGILPGYVTSLGTLQQEYLTYQGEPLDDPSVASDFEEAAVRMQSGKYFPAVTLLESVRDRAPVPVVFNNLGVLYAKLQDGPHEVAAFTEALARDFDYPPVRANVQRLNLDPAAMEPVAREVKPNDTYQHANLIGLGKPVDASIGGPAGAKGSFEDSGFFRFTSPASPRDLISIEVANRSETLAPRIRVFDAHGRLGDWSKETLITGASLSEQFSPPPNTTFFVEIGGSDNTVGPYTLTVRALKAFDAFEPNEDFAHARRIPLGQTIEANIMDARDTDFYSFLSPQDGAVTVRLQPRSKTLVAALATFMPDQRIGGVGSEERTPGAELQRTMEVRADQVYYVRVTGQAGSVGAYALTVR